MQSNHPHAHYIERNPATTPTPTTLTVLPPPKSPSSPLWLRLFISLFFLVALLTSQPSLSPPLQVPTSPAATAAHHLCIASFKDQSYVSSIALAGKSLLSAYSDGEVRSWSRHPDDNRQSSHGRRNDNVVAVTDSAVKSIVVVGDGIITAHQDHKIRVWKVDHSRRCDHSAHHQIYRIVTTLPTLVDRLKRMFSSENYVEVRRHKKCTWVHHVDAVSALALSHDGALLYSVSWDRSLKVWQTSDFKCLESVNNAHDDAINAVVVSLGPNRLVYTASADTKIKLWARRQRPEGDAHSLVATLEKHRSAVNALTLSGDGRVLYSGASDRSILVWERKRDGNGAAEGSSHMVVVGALRGHTEAILCLTVVSDLLISGSADRTIRVWRRGQGRSYDCLAVLTGHSRPVKCIATAAATAITTTSGDGAGSSGSTYMVYSGGLDCSVKAWQVWVPPI